MAAPALAPGQILADKYRIDRVLGRGAMGLVLAATNVQLDHPVAIKVLFGGSKGGREHEERFLREARVMALLKSEHVGRVLDVGRMGDDAPYLVMELLVGEDLAAYLGKRGRLPAEEAVDLILQACEGIAQAHAAGVIHRDVKPANLFLTRDVGGAPLVKVVDFGIAKKADDETALTKTGAALGSPLYMSPEQMRGSRDVDARADIWALGVTLYQLLTGAMPFPGQTITEVCTRVVLEPAVPIASHRPDLPGGLAAILDQCFQKDRERRWPSVTALAAALAPYAPAGAALHVQRVAGMQKIAAEPSRPTIELPKPTETALVAEAQRSTEAVVMPLPEPAVAASAASAAVVAAPRRAAAGSSRWAVLVGLGILAVGTPVGLFFALRPVGPAGAESRPGATASAATASVATVAVPTATTKATAAPSASVPRAIPSASAPPKLPASPRPTTPRPRVLVPVPVMPDDDIPGGTRR